MASDKELVLAAIKVRGPGECNRKQEERDMVKLTGHGVYLSEQFEILDPAVCDAPEMARTRTMAYGILKAHNYSDVDEILFGSMMTSEQIGDGSSREQAASCQKVLGGFANLANEYATKRYRSNLINWGILPLRTEEEVNLSVGDYVFLPDVCRVIESGQKGVQVEVLHVSADNGNVPEVSRYITCTLDNLTDDERKILLAGCLINYYME